MYFSIEYFYFLKCQVIFAKIIIYRPARLVRSRRSPGYALNTGNAFAYEMDVNIAILIMAGEDLGEVEGPGEKKSMGKETD